jgi:hypothetical protein
MIHLQDLLDLIKIYAMHKHISSEKKANSIVKEHAKYWHLNPRQILKNYLITLILIQTDGNLRVHSHSLTYDHPAYDQLKLQPKFP